MEKAVFGGGCFWCNEAIFEKIRGVEKVENGYAGGDKDNPDYDDVSSGQSGHAEVIRVVFDPKVIGYADLLYIFFRMHDPTTKNRQGADVGTQYRSVIFYADDKQKAEAIKALDEAQTEYKDKIVTELVPLENFYVAEEYHQGYYRRNGAAPYCAIVISPKIRKLEEKFGKYIKK